jgi:hypothetical protein
MKACRCIGPQVVTQSDSFPLIETRGADGPRCRPMDGKQKKAPVRPGLSKEMSMKEHLGIKVP